MSAVEKKIDKGAVDAIVGFLKSNVPRSSAPNVETELKTEFVLAKKRSKSQKRPKKNKRVKVLTRKEKKSLGFYNFPRNSLKYSDVLPLYKIWLNYINDVLELDKSVPDHNSKAWESFTLSLYKSDFHGSMLHVVRSKCPSYVGKMGICVMDTRNTFKIVSKDNIVSTIPKRECVFELYLDKCKITLFGKHFAVRPEARSNKKVKGHLIPDL